MIAWLDTALPPLDPALGFYLLLAACAGYAMARILDRARAEAAPDPYTAPHGDVPNRPKVS